MTTSAMVCASEARRLSVSSVRDSRTDPDSPSGLVDQAKPLEQHEVRIVVEVDRPNRQRRRRRGKSDPQDAISAARAAQSGDADGLAKTRDGNVETMRVLRLARNSARRSRTQALNQMRSIICTAWIG